MSFFTVPSTLRSGNGICWRHRAARQLSGPLRHRTTSAKITEVPEEWATPGVQLPPLGEWRKVFRFSEKQKRRTLSNPETARRLAELYVPEGSKDKVIVEAYTGPGMLTRALLDLPRDRIRKLILLEEEPKFFDWLKPLQKMDDRVHIIQRNPYNWQTYKELESEGFLDDVHIHDWNAGVHPHLHFISQVPNNVHGEQLVAQLCRAIPDRNWLFKFGRIPLDLIPSSALYKRLSAGKHNPTKICKLSVITQAVSTLTVTIPAVDLLPPQEHFFSPTSSTKRRHIAEVAQQALRIVPLEDQAIGPGEIVIWDYVLRHLFVMKATPLNKCITGLGPGATSLLKLVSDPSLPPDQRVDVNKSPNAFTMQEWKNITKAFKEWPFRPENLSIYGGFVASERV